MRESIPAPREGPRHGQGMVPGVKANGMIFFSAIRGTTPGEDRELTAEEESRQALENVRLLIEAAGGTLDNIVHVTLYLGDLNDRQAFHKVWMEKFPTNPPARIAVGVANASASPTGHARYALSVIATAPS
jgi:2-iminobutanoate/2-iminopropanoate deaminase